MVSLGLNPGWSPRILDTWSLSRFRSSAEASLPDSNCAIREKGRERVTEKGQSLERKMMEVRKNNTATLFLTDREQYERNRF